MSTEQNMKYKQQQQAREQKRTVSHATISQNKDGTMNIKKIDSVPSGLAKK